MLNSRILVALMSAVSSLGKSVRPWGNEPAPTIDHTAWWNGDHNRNRYGTRSNLRYVHDVIQMEQVHRDHASGIEWVDRWTEVNRPKRRAERKGINTVPRGFGDKNAIRF